jgi:hypothetical protein
VEMYELAEVSVWCNNMKIYRIENQETYHGMWYRLDGTFDPFIKKLSNAQCKDLPMDFHERYYKDRLKWFSGADNVKDLKYWFNAQDAFELQQNGYKLYQFESKQFIKEENQTLFTREGILSQQEIPLETIWNINKVNKERLVL